MAEPTPVPTSDPGAIVDYLKAHPEQAKELGLSFDNMPNAVFWWVLTAQAVVVIWFLLKRLARREEGAPRRWYEKLDPQVQALRAWLAAAPVTFIYVSCWTVTSVIIQGTPTTLVNVFDRFNSTNIAGILSEPLRVLFTSAFLVADYGFFFIGYVVVYALITARLEQRIGSARVIVVGAGAHVFGSLLMVGIESLAIKADLLAKTTVLTSDVGVSYVMVGTCGAYLFFITKKWRPWFATGLALGVVAPLIVSHTIWDLGHFLATSIGILLVLWVRRWGVRDRVTWRDRVASHPPRPLPTWSPAAQPPPSPIV